MCEELKRERIQGQEAACKLGEHVYRMGAAQATFPFAWNIGGKRVQFHIEVKVLSVGGQAVASPPATVECPDCMAELRIVGDKLEFVAHADHQPDTPKSHPRDHD